MENVIDRDKRPAGRPRFGARRSSRRQTGFTPRPDVVKVAIKVLAVLLVISALTALWRYTPLAELIDAGRVTAWAEEFSDRWWAPFVIILAYTPACIVMFPRPLITLAAVVAFGPQLGFVYALGGILIAALASYYAGLGLPRSKVHKLGGKRLFRLADILRRRSLPAITALRLVPVAPFVVVGMVAAAIGVRVLPFALGTLLGMLPGTLATTIFGDQFEALIDDPSRLNYGLIALAILVVVIASFSVRRWLAAQDGAPRHAEATQRTR